jgi:hypothetical protein
MDQSEVSPMATSSTTPESTARAPAALLRPVRATAFWAAVALPFVYVPLIVRGLESPTVQSTVALLLALHVVALVLGRHHRAE